MDAAVVVIEVAPPKPDAALLSALVAACNQASQRASCVLAEHAPESAPLAVAIVKGDGAHVRVEVGLRQEKQGAWHTREFDFDPHDDELERWRAVGFAIGTLAQTSEGAGTKDAPPASPSGAAAPPAASAVSEPAIAPAPALESPPPERSGAWFDGSFGTGPALEGGAWRLGGALRSGLEIVARGPYFAASTFFSKSLAERGANLELSWLGFAAGAGYPVVRAAGGQRLELRLEALVTRLQASASADDGRVDRGERWLIGGGAGLDGILPLTGWLGALASLELGVNAPTDIHVGGERIGTAPAFGFGISAGLRLRLR